jgi:YD repeat-containing protein
MAEAVAEIGQQQRPLGITTTFAFAETRGLSTAVPVDSAYTSIDGPRSDVADVTRIWINGHGAPTRVRNAVGRETSISYDAACPGLAAVTKGPSGLLTKAWYNNRGLPDSTIAYNPLGTGLNARTRYQWHATWDEVTQVTSPTGLVTTFGYNGTYGYREWEQPGPDQGRRVSYGYNGDRLLASVTAPSGTQYLYYDALGNLQRNRSPRGFDSYAYGDAIGRDTLTLSPFDSLPPGGSLLTRTRTFYSAVDRVDSVRTWGPAVSTPTRTHHADSVLVQNLYDPEGNRYSTTRLFRLNGAVRSLSSTWTYDDANRVTGDANPGAGGHTYILDPAGNVTTTYTPRGHSISVTYDELNRPVRKVLSQVNYANIGCPAFGGACLLFTFPTRDGPTVCLAGDTSSFDYDGAGNLRRADNGCAWVRRAYTPSGQVSHDTLVVRTYETSAPNPCGPGDRHSGGIASGFPDFTSHVYALRYSYDIEGRRTDLYHPDGVDFCPSGQCRTQYGYESATGLLSTVTDPLNYVTSFTYDAAGRDISTTYPGGVVMGRGYDADGGVVSRSGPFTSGDALTRDAQGRLVSGSIGDIAGNGPASIRLFYRALGAAVYTENLTKGATFEEDSVDAVGDRLWQRAYGIQPNYTDRHRRLFLDSYTGRLDSIRLVAPLPPGFPEVDTRHHVALYDAAGNSHQTYGWPNPHYGNGWEASLDEAVSYFDAEERLRIFNRHVDYGPVSGPGGVYEEYRYDALGRRVLVRSRCTADQTGDGNCRGYVERTIWDGDQVLYEIRSPGGPRAAPVRGAARPGRMHAAL